MVPIALWAHKAPGCVLNGQVNQWCCFIHDSRMQRAGHEGARASKTNDEKIKGSIKNTVFYLLFFWLKEEKLIQRLLDLVLVA